MKKFRRNDYVDEKKSCIITVSNDTSNGFSCLWEQRWLVKWGRGRGENRDKDHLAKYGGKR